MPTDMAGDIWTPLPSRLVSFSCKMLELLHLTYSHPAYLCQNHRRLGTLHTCLLSNTMQICAAVWQMFCKSRQQGCQALLQDDDELDEDDIALRVNQPRYYEMDYAVPFPAAAAAFSEDDESSDEEEAPQPGNGYPHPALPPAIDVLRRHIDEEPARATQRRRTR